jgi:hypothetical protein
MIADLVGEDPTARASLPCAPTGCYPTGELRLPARMPKTMWWPEFCRSARRARRRTPLPRDLNKVAVPTAQGARAWHGTW